MSVRPSQGFEELNVDHKIDFGVVELGFGNGSTRPMINLQWLIVGEGARLSTMTIKMDQGKFSKVHQMTYWHIGTLI